MPIYALGSCEIWHRISQQHMHNAWTHLSLVSHLAVGALRLPGWEQEQPSQGSQLKRLNTTEMTISNYYAMI